MEEKKAVLIFNIIAVFILVLDIVLVIISFAEYVKEHCSDELEENIKHYMYEHNLKDEDYNFNKIFWSSSESQSFGRGIGNFFSLLLHFVYIGLSIVGLIFYMTHLCKRNLCLLIGCIIFYVIVILFGVLEIEMAFDYKKLNEKDLNDFGELNKDIKKLNDSYLKSKRIIKAFSIIVCITPVYYIVTPFIIFYCLVKKNNYDDVNRNNANEIHTNEINVVRVNNENNNINVQNENNNIKLPNEINENN